MKKITNILLIFILISLYVISLIVENIYLKGLIAVILFWTIPYYTGRIILGKLLGRKINNSVREYDIHFSDKVYCIVNWTIGLYTLVLLFKVAVFLKFVKEMSYTIFIIVIAYMVYETFKEANKDGYHKHYKRQHKSDLIIITIGALIPLIIYKMTSPFPLEGTYNLFNINRETLQIIYNEKYLLSQHQAYFPFQQVLIAIISIVLNVDPFDIAWFLPFFFYVIFAYGVYICIIIMKEGKDIALLGSLISVWLMHVVFFKQIYMPVPRAFFHIITPWYTSIVVSYFLKTGQNSSIKESLRDLIFLVIIILVIFFIRVLFMNELREIVHVILFITLTLILFYGFSHQYYRFQYIFMSIFIILAHTYEGTIFLILMIIFSICLIVLRIVNKRDIYIIENLLAFTIILFILLQKTNIIVFKDNFTLSKYIFGSKYIGSQADVDFHKKYMIFMKANTKEIFYLSLIAAFLLPYFNIKYTPFSMLYFICLFVYFFPEGFTYRASYMLTIFPIIISVFLGNLAYSIPHSRIVFKINYTIKVKLKAIILLIFFIIIFPYISNAVKNEYEYTLYTGYYHTVFEIYEYKAGMWIKKHCPRNTLIISEPYTTIILASLSNTYLYFAPRWKFPKEYYQEDLERMNMIKKYVFLENNCEKILLFIRELRNNLSIYYSLNNLYYLHKGKYIPDPVNKIQPNATIVIVITPRVSAWLKSNSSFLYYYRVKEKQIEWHYFSKFNNSDYFKLLTIIDRCVYIYKVEINNN